MAPKLVFQGIDRPMSKNISSLRVSINLIVSEHPVFKRAHTHAHALLPVCVTVFCLILVKKTNTGILYDFASTISQNIMSTFFICEGPAFAAVTRRGPESTRPLKVCCGIRHRGLSNRSFKSCKFWGGVSTDQTSFGALGNLEETPWSCCVPKTIPEAVSQCGRACFHQSINQL